MKYKTSRQLSVETGIRRTVISHLAREGKIASIKISKTLYLIDIASFIEYLRWGFFPRNKIREKNKKIKMFIEKYKKQSDDSN